jgi:hypothetical protein
MSLTNRRRRTLISPGVVSFRSAQRSAALFQGEPRFSVGLSYDRLLEDAPPWSYETEPVSQLELLGDREGEDCPNWWSDWIDLGGEG